MYHKTLALSSVTSALHLAVKLAGERLYGKPNPGHGTLEGKNVFCSDVTFDATVSDAFYSDMEEMVKKQTDERHKKLLRKIQIIEKAKGRNFDVNEM